MYCTVQHINVLSNIHNFQQGDLSSLPVFNQESFPDPNQVDFSPNPNQTSPIFS